MKTLKQYIKESLSDEELDEKACEIIKATLRDYGINVHYVETCGDDEYPMLYVATCDYGSIGKWRRMSSTAHSGAELDALEEDMGGIVKFIKINDGPSLYYAGKRCFEICFA